MLIRKHDTRGRSHEKADPRRQGKCVAPVIAELLADEHQARSNRRPSKPEQDNAEMTAMMT